MGYWYLISNVRKSSFNLTTCRLEEEKDHMFEGMRREHEAQIEELRQQVVAAIGNEKLKRDAER